MGTRDEKRVPQRLAIPFSEELQVQIAEARSTLEKIEKHENGIMAIDEQLREAEGKLRSIQTAIGVRAANSVLAGGQPEVCGAELRDAQASVETLRSAREALRRSLLAVRAGAESASGALRRAFNKFGAQVFDRFAEEHAVVARKYADSVELGTALAFAFSRDLPALSHLRIPDPCDVGKSLIPRDVNMGDGRTRPRWTTMPDILAEVDAVGPIRDLLRDLERQSDRAVRERPTVVGRPSVTGGDQVFGG
ncbi:MAG TPA: hypothetical protein VHB50_14305 [Bryobacteraceae bacterium]|nr:hypothetical protein [Bryobacteraceae bacterium]